MLSLQTVQGTIKTWTQIIVLTRVLVRPQSNANASVVYVEYWIFEASEPMIMSTITGKYSVPHSFKCCFPPTGSESWFFHRLHWTSQFRSYHSLLLLFQDNNSIHSPQPPTLREFEERQRIHTTKLVFVGTPSFLIPPILIPSTLFSLQTEWLLFNLH